MKRILSVDYYSTDASSPKGDGPSDYESQEWCDKMLLAMGFILF